MSSHLLSFYEARNAAVYVSNQKRDFALLTPFKEPRMMCFRLRLSLL